MQTGIEVATHAMRQVLEDSEYEGMLLSDAENTFNNLNREEQGGEHSKISKNYALPIISISIIPTKHPLR